MLRISAGGPGTVPEARAAELAETCSGVSLTWYTLHAGPLPTQLEIDDYGFRRELEAAHTLIQTADYHE